MGLGGYLAWTAVAKEIRAVAGQGVKCLPVEQRGQFITIVDSPIFKNCLEFSYSSNCPLFPLVLNNPDANYCKKDTPDKAYHRQDKHIIEQYCEVYGIKNPKLRCYLTIPGEEKHYAKGLVDVLTAGRPFIVIEPGSKKSYTVNREYPFEKWQKVVNELCEHIDIIQVGIEGSRPLENAINLTGKTNFLQAVHVIEKSKMFLSSEGGLVHAATAVDTKSLVIITGYQSKKMVAYPQNINIDISSHGPCGLKSECAQCKKESADHDWREIVQSVKRELCL